MNISFKRQHAETKIFILSITAVTLTFNLSMGSSQLLALSNDVRSWSYGSKDFETEIFALFIAATILIFDLFTLFCEEYVIQCT